MATDNIEICNKALLMVGAQKITALTDNTAEADACEFLYDDVRRRLLTKFDWPFATATVDLGGYSDTDVSGWDYQFNLPAGLLRMISVECEATSGTDLIDGLGEATRPPNNYEIRGTNIFTDIENSWVKYVNDVTDTTAFPQDFEYALVTLLAAELAVPLTGNVQMELRLMQKFRMALGEAYASSAQLQRTDVIPLEGDWIDARHDG